MKTTRLAEINPTILAWARESAGLSLDEAAERVGLSAASAEKSGAEKLAELERGDRFPTPGQLLRFSAVYHRPLVAFYMRRPPSKGERGEDFRSLAANSSPREAALLDALLRDIRARQEMVKSLLEDDDSPRLPFVGATSLTDGVSVAVDRMADVLRFDVTRPRRTHDDLFRDLRSCVERVGVFVVLAGDLGSHHTKIGEDIFRGFVVADDIAPFIVLNSCDAKSARSFTLLHEFCHILLGQSGISGATYSDSPSSDVDLIERFCDDTASEFLLPDRSLGSPSLSTKSEALEAISKLSKEWAVSEPMVAYRLHRKGHLATSIYRQVAADFAIRWQAFKSNTTAAVQDRDGGPNYYVVKRHRLGPSLLALVRRKLDDNEITHTKAAKVLGVKPTSVEALLRIP